MAAEMKINSDLNQTAPQPYRVNDFTLLRPLRRHTPLKTGAAPPKPLSTKRNCAQPPGFTCKNVAYVHC